MKRRESTTEERRGTFRLVLLTEGVSVIRKGLTFTDVVFGVDSQLVT